MNERVADDVVELGRLVATFATIKRVTFLEDGVTPESDTDHTVMLGVVACALAQTYDTRLDVGLVAQFALVHDLVEAYAGDTNTFGGLSSASHRDKEERETAALARIASQFQNTLPWVSETISEYESLQKPEARFVKTLDKIMPKLTRILNSRHETSALAFDTHCAEQYATISAFYGSDQEMVLAIYSILTERVSAYLHEAQGSTKTEDS